MKLIEYHLLVPMFADPVTALEGKPEPIQRRMRSALRRRLIEAAFLRARARVQSEASAHPKAEEGLTAVSPELELEVFLGDTVAAWCSDELQSRILDEAFQVRLPNPQSRILQMPKESMGFDGIEGHLLCGLTRFDLLESSAPKDHEECETEDELKKLARKKEGLPLEGAQEPGGQEIPFEEDYQETDEPEDQVANVCLDTIVASCKSNARQPLPPKLRRLALLTHRYAWRRLEHRRREFGVTRCFLSSAPIDGCYFKKVGGSRGTWDLSVGLLLYVDEHRQEEVDWYLANEAHFDLVQDAVYYHKNGLPFMPQLG